MICAVPSLAAGSVLTYLNNQASLPRIAGPNKVAGVAERLVCDVPTLAAHDRTPGRAGALSEHRHCCAVHLSRAS